MIQSNQKNTSKILRSSNIEFLRIFSMIMIVAHHFAVHGGFEYPSDSLSFNRLWVQFLEIGGKLGVNIFVLISGYFLIDSKAIKVKKLIKLWCQIFFYSMAIFGVFVFARIEEFSVKELIKSLAPITFNQWWFASTYFVLYLFHPFINLFLKCLEKKQYKKFLVIALFCWCVIPSFTGQRFQSNEFVWFIVLYSIGSYTRLFEFKEMRSPKLIIFSISMIILTYLSAVSFDVLGLKYASFANHSTYFYDMQRFPILISSFLLFLGFSKLKFHNNKIINIISSATFGCYLIHENPLVRPFIWKTIFNVQALSDNKLLWVYSIIVISLVFIVTIIIELVRIYLIEKMCSGLLEKTSNFIDLKILNKLEEKRL